VSVTFQGFDRGGSHTEGQQLSVGATLQIAKPGEPAKTVIPRIGMGEQGMTPTREPVQNVPGAWVELAGINADLGRVRLMIGGLPGVKSVPGEPATFVADLTIKPGISLLWLGLAVLLVGGTLALVRRGRETDVLPQPPQEAPVV
jgi:cytochrome c-type biogenesis protein CcmF